MRDIMKFGKRVEAERYAACIFPEGTRARDGVMKPFIPAGLIALLAVGSWKLLRHNLTPVPFGVRVSCKALAPIDQEEYSVKELVGIAEQRIRDALGAGSRI